ncbi:Fc receptor-like protein 5 isoform X2 [Lepidochelys kempii]|uniref:Fc receptor-like protein 5 isoform X2 n=1 Tax=Lepidochelys kempii TaxID=8472 RepID=UPI003C6EAE0D
MRCPGEGAPNFPRSLASVTPLTWLQILTRLVSSEGTEEPSSSSALSPSASVPDPLPPPTLSLGSQNPVYYQGERVSLTCSAPSGEAVTGYRFYRRRGDQTPEELQSAPGASRLELRAETGNQGPYTCQYWRKESGLEIPSTESNKVYITVQAPLAAPTLSLHPPHPFYLHWERVTLRCSAPGGKRLQGYRFYGEQERLIHEEVPAPDGGARLEIVAEMGKAGVYTCAYWTLRSGRHILSEGSRPVSLSVQAPLPAPTLWLDPPHSVYLPEERVNLSCSAPRAQEVTGYRLYKLQPEQGSEELPASRGGPRWEILAAVGHEGPYTCRYWRRGPGRELPSGLSQPIAIRVTDPPRRPSVSLSPDYLAYVAGERVEINCLAPPGASPVEYGLYKNEEPVGSLLGDTGTWLTDLQVNGTRNATHSFSCTYTELIQGRAVPSYASHSVSVSVFLALVSPSLRLIPSLPLYVTGETVSAECIIPNGTYVPSAHWVLRDGEPLPEPPEPQLPLNVTPSDSGTYRCGYSTELHGRHLRSPPSNPVPLSVTDPPPQPVLSMFPPSRVVSEGLPLLITCLAPGNTSERRFHFYKDGAEIIPGDTGSEISTMEPSTGSMNFSVLSIPRAGPNNAGEFSCGYEANMGGRWIPSPRSQAVNVTVTTWSLPIPMVAGSGGAATALALLLLLICLCRKKKAATRRLSTSYWKSQELRQSRIMTRSTDISGVNIFLQQTTKGGWPQAASQDWGLLPKLPAERPRPGRAAGGAAPLKGQEEDDADSGAEFEFPDIDPTYTQLTFSCSTFRQGQGLSASLEHVCSTPDL